jgi:hypothetical protein
VKTSHHQGDACLIPPEAAADVGRQTLPADHFQTSTVLVLDAASSRRSLIAHHVPPSRGLGSPVFADVINTAQHQGPTCFNRLAISMAAMAASQPLLPALEPARSMACSNVSVVKTPNETGTPVSRLTVAIPLETSLAT